MMWVIVVNLSPDPAEQYAIGPFQSERTALEYLNSWADMEPDGNHEYAQVWPLNQPDEGERIA
jgi:hypothetical protein